MFTIFFDLTAQHHKRTSQNPKRRMGGFFSFDRKKMDNHPKRQKWLFFC